MTPTLFTWLVIATAACGQLPTDKPQAEVDVAKLIDQLGSNRFAEREAAMDDLWKVGEGATPFLERATKSDDPEIRTRAAMIIDRFKLGIYHDTPDEVANLIRIYRSNAADQLKIQAIRSLQEMGEWKALGRLIESETNPTLRSLTVNIIRTDGQRKIASSIEAGKLNDAEQMLNLQLPIGDVLTQRQLATLYHVSGQTRDKIAELTKQQDLTAPKRRLLALLQHINGDDAGVAAALAKTNDRESMLTNAVQRGKWTTAAQIATELASAKEATFQTALRAAMLQQLAGNDQVAEEQFQKLMGMEKTLADKSWLEQDVQLLNGKISEAIAGLKTTRPSMALELLCIRQQYSEGLQLTTKSTYDQGWLDALPIGEFAGDATQQQMRRYTTALQTTFFLAHTGQKKDTETILKLLRESNKGGSTIVTRPRRTELCRIELRMGMVEQAFLDSRLTTSTSAPDVTMFPLLFGQQSTSASNLRTLLLQNRAEIPVSDQLVVLRQLLRPTPAEIKNDQSWRQFVETAAAKLEDDKSTLRFTRYAALADVYLAHGMRKEAIALLTKAEGNALSFMRLGDLLREDQQFAAAAEQYGKIPEIDRTRPLALYLRGCCEDALEHVNESQKWKNSALLLAVDDTARTALVTGLIQRDLKAEARDVIAAWRQSSPELGAVLARDTIELFLETDLSVAKEAWKQLVAQAAMQRQPLAYEADYVELPLSLHRAEAIAAIAADRRDEFLREFAICRQLHPSDWKTVLDIVPRLDAKEWRKEADALFAEQFVGAETLCKTFPDSARFSNNLAWGCGVCRRQLDLGLVQAKRTLELEPQNASFHDTLAEVHYARGEYAEAVAAARKAVELAPESSTFKTRLAKFEAAATGK